ncbi:DUF4293 domain-containing protein [uncultured Prevotella sp.]|uniref:DUF4293 domain-containing protein n=1 Tax=uncultured Prevotella sp. TaxID=159272 RepID=UPI0026340CA5|nr:DUF4293 domain-containing protein [uncultured Prevotella sp.]
MIQRKQTLFLLAAVILSIVCLCLPLGTFVADGSLNQSSTMFNLWITMSDGSHDYSVWVLFAILLITCPIALIAIFMYHNRIVQSRFCLFNILLIIGWYAVYAVFTLNLKETVGEYNISFSSILPMISLILYFMARKAIISDEALVRAADRIR